MADSTLFSKIKLGGKTLKECDMVLECSGNDYRLYATAELGGFYAMAVGFASCTTRDPDIWGCEDLRVSKLFYAIAYGDGVRHLEFNRDSDMPGYIYYPDMAALSIMFAKIRELEFKHCPSFS